MNKPAMNPNETASKTPLTDEFLRRMGEKSSVSLEWIALRKHARTLETSLARLQSENEKLTKERLVYCETCNHPMSQCGHEGVDGEPSLDCKVCTLRAELAEARKMNQDRVRERDEALRDRWKWESELAEAKAEAKKYERFIDRISVACGFPVVLNREQVTDTICKKIASDKQAKIDRNKAETALATALATVSTQAALIAELQSIIQKLRDCEDGPSEDLSGDAQNGVHCGVEDVGCVNRYDGANYGYSKGVAAVYEWLQGMLPAKQPTEPGKEAQS